MSAETARPSIRIQANRQVGDAEIADIRHGMEEEGVPSELTRHDELNPLLLAHRASIESRLGVGVGVSLGYLVITTEKLPPERPYIAVRLGADDGLGRTLGANAARLVKRIPLLELTNR